jgi:hypothetical protein
MTTEVDMRMRDTVLYGLRRQRACVKAWSHDHIYNYMGIYRQICWVYNKQ